MNKSELFKAAHKLAKSVIKAGDNYRVTFGAALKMILSESVKATFIVEYNDSWNGFCKQEIEATSHKEAMQIFESKNRRKCFSVSKKSTEVVEEVEDAEDILFQMDSRGVDSIKFKTNRGITTISRVKVEAYIKYKNENMAISRLRLTR